MHLRAERRVCLVGFEQALQHYSAVARRFGVHLPAEAQAGRFTFVDGFSNPFSPAATTPDQSVDLERDPRSGLVNFSISLQSLESSVQQFTKLISKIVRSDSSDCCIVIDGLSTFLDSASEMEEFLGDHPHLFSFAASSCLLPVSSCLLAVFHQLDASCSDQLRICCTTCASSPRTRPSGAPSSCWLKRRPPLFPRSTARF